MPLYELNHITHRYNGQTVLSIDRWSLPGNAIIGLAGPNGSGKSTLLKLLGFVMSPSGGDILFNGQKSEPFTSRVRDEVVLFPQDAYLLKRNVYHNVGYGLKIRHQKRDRSKLIEEALALVGLDPAHFVHRPWFALSGGETRRVALAARLALRPKVLLLDEPTTSVDAASAQSIKEAVMHAHHHWGTNLVITSHDMSWLQEICDDIVQLFQGKILGNDPCTFLFGPWQELDHHKVYINLSDEERFVAVKAKGDMRPDVAAVRSDRLTLYPMVDQIPSEKYRIQGVVAHLGLGKSTGRIHASIKVGNSLFVLYVDPTSFPKGDLFPGRRVWIAYSPEDVMWY